MERGLLSDSGLAGLYDRVVWMYLYQDFSHSEADRAAERVAIRFGISSWPQHFLIDPHTLEVLGDTGRQLGSFRRAVADAKVDPRGPVTSAQLAAADAAARALEGGDVRAALAGLGHDDVVVRFRAVEVLAAKAPDRLVAAAGELLATPHDQIRFQVCAVLAEHGDERAREPLERLAATPAHSRNPNVLRIRAVQALARCGSADSIEVIAPHATSGAWFNGLTGTSIDTLAALAGRLPRARDAVRDVLVAAFPQPPADGDERSLRACTALARRVHGALVAVTGRERPFPASYTESTRAQLATGW